MIRSQFTRYRVGVLLLAWAATAPAMGQEWTEHWPDPPPDQVIEFPASLDSKLERLTAEQREFISSRNNVRQFASPEKLVETLEQRSPDEVVAYVEAMIWVTRQQQFEAGRDQATIPLDTDSPEFKSHLVRRPASFDPPREPGPIDLSRYGMGSRFTGSIPTYANAPVAITPEDLIAGEVDVAFVGAPLNMGGGWRDGADGPKSLRPFGRRSSMGGNDQYTQVNPGRELNIVDYGDIAIDNFSTERSVQHVREVVREIAETGAIPFIIGGDHSLEYPNVAALVDVYGKGNLTVIHFDAHSDISRDRAHMIDHGQPIYRLISEGHITGADYVQVGLRAGGPNETQFTWARNQGFRYHTMAEVERYGWDAVMDRIVSAIPKGRKLHISFDVDVLDPSYILGTGTPVSGGMTPREAIPIVRRLCAQANVVGFDIVEIQPALDPGYATTLHSSAIVQACLVGIAMHRLGLDPGHLSPISIDHAQDDYHQRQGG
ncbi:MAG: agmatinase family protein [Gammaproteobacteria bacterium]|nr:agmatinase family protein [Gammaproteobacteria bacterium]